MAQSSEVQPNAEMESSRSAPEQMQLIYRWAIGAAVVAVVLLASLLIWGSEMEFPTTLSLETSTDGSVAPSRSRCSQTRTSLQFILLSPPPPGGSLQARPYGRSAAGACRTSSSFPFALSARA